jgi:K+-sensing histidine kinase KdpD
VVSLLDPEGARLEVVAAQGYPSDIIERYRRLPLEPGLPMTDALLLRTPLLIETRKAALQRYPDLADTHRRIRLRAWATMPLLLDERPIGVLEISFDTPRRFDEEDQTFLMTLARQCAQALDRARLYERAQRARAAAERAADQAQRLQRVSAALSSALTPRQVASMIIREGLSALDADAGAIFVLSDDRQQFVALDFLGYPFELAPEHITAPAGRPGPLRDALETRELVIVATPEEMLARWPNLRGAQAATGDATTAAVPLLADGRVVGVFYVAFRRVRVFSAEDRAFLTTLAQQCTQALERARLYDAEQAARAVAERAAARALQLQQVTAALSQALTPAQVAEVIIRQGLEAVGAYAGVLILCPPGSDHFAVLASIGYPAGVMNQWGQVPLDAPMPLAETARSGEAIWIASPKAYAQRYPALAPAPTETSALAALPLNVRGRVIGALGLSFRETQPFPPEDRAYMLTLAHQCALALERARLFNEAQVARARAERAADRTERLQQVTAALSEALTPAQVGAVVVHQALHAMGAQRGYVSLLAPDRSRLELLHQTGYSLEHIAQTWPMEMDRPLPMADVVRSAEPMFMETIEEAPSAYRGEGSWARLSSSAALLPLLIEGHAIGGMSLGFQSGRSFSAEDQAFLLALARQCAQALERARLYEEERAARAEAETALGVRDTFFSVAAHELKTPLTSLLGQAQLFQRRARRECTLGERDQRSLEVVIDQALRLNKMVSALLDISRLDQGQLSIEPQPLDLAALIRRVVDEILPTLDRHTIATDLPERPLVLAGDPLRLEQVLQNLIGNAVKYMPLGGAVTVRAGRRGGRAWVAVADEGIGIPPDALPHLFTRFYRAANSYPMHISGMGIGLYVVREIVTLHGGEVAAESVEGRGSTFTVVLPLLEAAEQLRAAPGPAPGGAG